MSVQSNEGQLAKDILSEIMEQFHKVIGPVCIFKLLAYGWADNFRQ